MKLHPNHVTLLKMKRRSSRIPWRVLNAIGEGSEASTIKNRLKIGIDSVNQALNQLHTDDLCSFELLKDHKDTGRKGYAPRVWQLKEETKQLTHPQFRTIVDFLVKYPKSYYEIMLAIGLGCADAKTIAERLGYDKATVYLAVTKLVDVGIVKIHTVGGQFEPHTYELTEKGKVIFTGEGELHD